VHDADAILADAEPEAEPEAKPGPPMPYFTAAEVEEMLGIVQRLDPAGVAAPLRPARSNPEFDAWARLSLPDEQKRSSTRHSPRACDPIGVHVVFRRH